MVFSLVSTRNHLRLSCAYSITFDYKTPSTASAPAPIVPGVVDNDGVFGGFLL